ncbi:hypothetical protein NWFMUON74_02130 [Nocardia wallacei]|uniref:Uncharacterized protein n=1 Tax=Nocardia wallacei TaxID=480035 RepID=A0A7G1KC79_9NOCA|nr:hypothetical protein NWFMUON74_02130 [Nocardia wallacei]
MGIEGQAVVQQSLRVVQRLVGRKVQIVGYALDTDAARRQRAPESVPGAGISGASDIVSITFDHHSMIHGFAGAAIRGSGHSRTAVREFVFLMRFAVCHPSRCSNYLATLIESAIK